MNFKQIIKDPGFVCAIKSFVLKLLLKFPFCRSLLFASGKILERSTAERSGLKAQRPDEERFFTHQVGGGGGGGVGERAARKQLLEWCTQKKAIFEHWHVQNKNLASLSFITLQF